MSIKTKIAAILICIVMVCGTLVSCDIIGQGNNGNNQNLQTDKYTLTVTTQFATNDEKMKSAINALGAANYVINVDGDDLQLENSTELQGASVDNSYIYVDGTLYHAQTVSVGDKQLSSYEKSIMTVEEREALVSNLGTGASIGIGDFLDQQMNTFGATTTYICSEMDEESKASLSEIYEKKFAAIGAEVIIDSASYQLEVLNGRNHKSVLSCDFVIILDGEEYKLTVHTYYTYDYDAEFSISAPENADRYTETSTEDIIG